MIDWKQINIDEIEKDDIGYKYFDTDKNKWIYLEKNEVIKDKDRALKMINYLNEKKDKLILIENNLI